MQLSSQPRLSFGSYSFRGAVFDGVRVWLLPLDANMFVRIDINTLAVSTLPPPSARSAGLGNFYSGTFDGRRIWMAPYDASDFLRVDTMTDEFMVWNTSHLSGSVNVTLHPQSQAFVSCNFDGELVWYIPQTSKSWLTLNSSKDFDAT